MAVKWFQKGLHTGLPAALSKIAGWKPITPLPGMPLPNTQISSVAPTSINAWVGAAAAIAIIGAIGAADRGGASDPADRDSLFDPAADKTFRHPTDFALPDEVANM